METTELLSRIPEIVARGLTTPQLFEKAAGLKDLKCDQSGLPIKPVRVGQVNFRYTHLTALTTVGFKEFLGSRPLLITFIDESLNVSSDEIVEEPRSLLRKREDGWRLAGNFRESLGKAPSLVDFANECSGTDSGEIQIPGSLPGRRENCWHFRNIRPIVDQLPLEFFVNFQIDADKGILIKPAIATDLDWPEFLACHQRLLSAIFSFPTLADRTRESDLHPIMEEIAAAEGTLTVSWEQLGLTGILTIHDLFDQFCGQNQLLWRLVETEINPFNPRPTSYGRPADLWFLPNEALNVFQIWRWQLNNHIASLGL